ncbi:hypothetical protein COU61_03005 [Candidatus Pacearchaeota archaeon CG10_big_fil_rev_8_21_14_0_10_35_13]|nr:MAG: hypothetical protein COU61_03005 [Candidatus Pacearchaeota archaeon CG10_big_fil_rev_8_21_14_0_10_35_13]
MIISKKSVSVGVFLLMIGLTLGVVIGQGGSFSSSLPYHPLQQVTTGPSSTTSVDGNGNGNIDLADKSKDSDKLGGKTLAEVQSSTNIKKKAITYYVLVNESVTESGGGGLAKRYLCNFYNGGGVFGTMKVEGALGFDDKFDGLVQYAKNAKNCASDGSDTCTGSGTKDYCKTYDAQVWREIKGYVIID